MGTSRVAASALDIGWPINSISNGFPTAEKYWEWPQPLVGAENLLEIIDLTHVIGTAIRFTFLVQVFNGGFVCCRQENVEPQEHCHQTRNYSCKDKACLDQQSLHKLTLIISFLPIIEGVQLPS